MVIKADPISNHAAGRLQRFEAVPAHATSLERADHPLDHAVVLGTMRRDELRAQPEDPNQGSKLRLVESSPFSERSRNGDGTRPSVPKRAIKACSSAYSAVFELPLGDRCQPNSSRMWQSMTSAIDVLLSRPAQTRQMSVAPRSFEALATTGSD